VELWTRRPLAVVLEAFWLRAAGGGSALAARLGAQGLGAGAIVVVIEHRCRAGAQSDLIL
jgi:hypothetical protein